LQVIAGGRKNRTMEPETVRIEPEQLRELVETWAQPGITLRPVTADDVHVAVDLMERTSRELQTPMPADRERQIRNCTAAVEQGDLLVFVEQEGSPIGTLRGELLPLSASRRELYISYIHLLPEWRSAGLGSQLLRHLARWLPSVGADAVTLDYMAYNPRVAPFYARLGFELVGYDLLRKLDSDVVPAGYPDGVRVYDVADEQSVVRFLLPRRGLATFEEPSWPAERIEALLRQLDTASDQRLFLVEREGALRGACWALRKLAHRGGTITVSLCFESDAEPTCKLLLDALDTFAAEERAGASYLTVWQPCASDLELALARGYSIGRYKARKMLRE
jgi:ribosomal protein S18 acetylase RimI-like enzyme